VIGSDVPQVLFEAIVDVPAESVGRALASLQVAGFLYEASLFPDVVYRFKSALARPGAGESVLAGGRARSRPRPRARAHGPPGGRRGGQDDRLIDRVHPAPELESRARELAASLAALAPLTIAATKEATRRVLAALAPRDLEERAHSFAEVPTQIAGEDEIVEKRKPDWQGR